jgi:hypothetical protein
LLVESEERSVALRDALLGLAAVAETLVLAARHVGGKRGIGGGVVERVLGRLQVVARLAERGAGAGGDLAADRRIVGRPFGNVRGIGAGGAVDDVGRFMDDDRGLAGKAEAKLTPRRRRSP